MTHRDERQVLRKRYALINSNLYRHLRKSAYRSINELIVFALDCEMEKKKFFFFTLIESFVLLKIRWILSRFQIFTVYYPVNIFI